MESLWLLAILWAVVSFLGRLGNQRRRQEEEEGSEPEEILVEAGRPERTRQGGAHLPDPSEEWRREIERLLGIEGGPERGPLGRPSPVGLPEAEDIEERESLEIEPEVVSMEPPPVRRERPVRVQDEEVLPVLRRRLEVAEMRGRGRDLADHRRFDQRIRETAPAPAPASAAGRRGRPSLRQAVVWREVLGPPVALREDRPGT